MLSTSVLLIESEVESVHALIMSPVISSYSIQHLIQLFSITFRDLKLLYIMLLVEPAKMLEDQIKFHLPEKL